MLIDKVKLLSWMTLIVSFIGAAVKVFSSCRLFSSETFEKQVRDIASRFLAQKLKQSPLEFQELVIFNDMFHNFAFFQSLDESEQEKRMMIASGARKTKSKTCA